MTIHRRVRRTLSLSLLTAAVVVGIAPNVGAHEGEGILTVESRAPAGDRAVSYVVRLTWADDDHPALQSTVTATPIAPDGSPQTPVTLEPVDEDGRYQATVTYPAPGDWTVRFNSVTPTGSIEVTEAIRSDATTMTAPTTSSTDGREASEDDDGSLGAAPDQTSDPDDGDGSGIGSALALAVLIAVVVAAALGFVRSTRRFREDT